MGKLEEDEEDDEEEEAEKEGRFWTVTTKKTPWRNLYICGKPTWLLVT